jgi:hypothetical protein
MRNFLLFATAVFLFASGSFADAQESAKDLVIKLGSRSYTEREIAAKKLEQLGLSALPALRVSMASADLETRRRAVVVMERIEDRAIQREIVQASPLHLRFVDEPLDQALLAVQKQTNLFLGFAERKSRLTVDTGVLPYWQAWGAFCKAAHLEEYDRMSSGMKLKRVRPSEVEELKAMVQSRELHYRATYQMPTIEFASEAASAGYAVDDRHSVRVRLRWESVDRLEKEKAPHAVFALEVRPEPRLALAALPRAEITKIVDAEGREHTVKAAPIFPVAFSADEEVYLAAFVGEIQYNGLLQRKSIPWPEPVRALKEVHGRVRLEVNARPPLMEISNVMKAVGTEQRLAQGPIVKIVKVDREETHVHLRLHVENAESLTPKGADPKVIRVRPGVAAVMGPMDVVMQRLEVRDARGWKCKELEATYQAANEGGGYLAYLIVEAPQAGELTLLLTKDARRVAVDVPFVVRNVAPPELKATGKK